MFVNHVILTSEDTEGSAKDYFNAFVVSKHSHYAEWVRLRDFIGTRYPFNSKLLYQYPREGNITTFDGLPKTYSDIVDTFAFVNFLLMKSKSTNLHIPTGGFPTVNYYTRFNHGIK